MKKFITLLVLATMSIFLISCSSDDDYFIEVEDSGISINDIMNALQEDGYNFDYQENDEADIRTSDANTLYSINITITDVFIGSKSGLSDTVDLLNFDNTASATEFCNAIDTQDTTGLLYYQAGDTVAVTYTQAAIDILDAIPQP